MEDFKAGWAAGGVKLANDGMTLMRGAYGEEPRTIRYTEVRAPVLAFVAGVWSLQGQSGDSLGHYCPTLVRAHWARVAPGAPGHATDPSAVHRATRLCPCSACPN